MRRLLLLGVGVAVLAVPVSVLGVVLSSPAGATPGAVTCGKLSGTSSNITIKKCSPKNKADKKLSGNGAALASGGSLTWSPSGGTITISAPTLTGTTPVWGTCKVNAKTEPEVTEFIATGSVVSDTSGYAAPGGAFSASVCLNAKTGKLSLAPGTTANF